MKHGQLLRLWKALLAVLVLALMADAAFGQLPVPPPNKTAVTANGLVADLMARRSGEGAQLRLIVYPGAYHAFNSRRDKPLTLLGHHIEYNEAADRAAWQETVEALRQAFVR
jgi:dienelactone hydrolase